MIYPRVNLKNEIKCPKCGCGVCEIRLIEIEKVCNTDVIFIKIRCRNCGSIISKVYKYVDTAYRDGKEYKKER